MFDVMQPELLRFYEQTEARLSQLIGQTGITAFQQRRYELLLQQIDSTIRALEEHQRGWCRKYLPRAYRQGYALTNEAWRMPVLPPMTLINRQAIEAAIARTMTETSQALGSVAPFCQRTWIDTQQALIREQQLARLIAEGQIEGLGPEELARRIKATLQDAASERLKGHISDDLRARLERTARGEVVTITTRSGKLMNYKLSNYGRLVARTAPRFAATEGAIQRNLEVGGDLVQVSVHSGACPLCIDVQGKLYSISGATSGFPALTDDVRPPIHPNCRHVLVGVSVDVLEERGELDALREISASDQPVLDLASLEERIGEPAMLGAAV
jgi:hypothetical protein